MNPDELKKTIDDRIKLLIPEYLKNQGFTARKLGDSPLDDFSLIPRKYVNANGSIASAPVSSVVGQQYFASDLGYPVFKNTIYRWVNSVGSVVA